jgi:predicted RNA-binding Zn-ribbon protein involved in translation (DUF1610 family)
MPYPGEVEFKDCPLCGEIVRLVCKEDFKYHGTCPDCGKEIVEDK